MRLIETPKQQNQKTLAVKFEHGSKEKNIENSINSDNFLFLDQLHSSNRRSNGNQLVLPQMHALDIVGQKSNTRVRQIKSNLNVHSTALSNHIEDTHRGQTKLKQRTARMERSHNERRSVARIFKSPIKRVSFAIQFSDNDMSSPIKAQMFYAQEQSDTLKVQTTNRSKGTSNEGGGIKPGEVND